MTSKKDVLSPLRGEVVRRPYLVFDIESKDGNTQKAGFTRPFFVGLYDGTMFYSFRGPNCVAEALAFMLCGRYEGYNVFAHNGGRFDFLHLLPYLRDAALEVEIVNVASCVQLMRVKSQGSHSRGVTFLDSIRLVPMALSKAAKSFGVTEKLASHDLDLHEDDPSWEDYNRVDCVALHEVLGRFHELVEDHLGGEVGVTAASTSMRTFRRRFQSGDIERNSEYHGYVRGAYYGGRVEIHRRAAKGLRYYDINSAYPRAMLEPMPVGKASKWRGRPAARQLHGSVGFATACVRVPTNLDLPVLPYRDPESGRLLFPAGEFTGTWDAIELLEAERQGCEVEWLDSVWYEAKPVLAPMVEAIYPYRDKSRADYDEGLAALSKILLNSLYGKFGMNPEKELIVFRHPGVEIPDGARPAEPGNPESLIWYVPKTVDAPYIVPQIAAHVTALARLQLYKWMRLASERGELAYVDTDSVITTADLSDVCGTELGALKDEGAGVTYDGTFLQPKLYRLDGSDGSTKVTMKGYQKRTAERFEKVKAGEVISFDVLEKIGSMARRGFESGPRMLTVTRQAKSEDRKRIYLPDGSTRPVVISER